jgi:ELWxxDGT repeat protein
MQFLYIFKLKILFNMRSFFTLLTMVVCISAQAQYSLTTHNINAITGSTPHGYTSFNGKTYFMATDTAHGEELWWSDGHSYGMVADIYPGNMSSFGWQGFGENLCVLGNKLYFPAFDSAKGIEIFQYDGVNPPVVAFDLDTTAGIRAHLTALGGRLYFMATTSAMPGTQLWWFDPLTKSRGAISSAITLNNQAPLHAFKNKLVFAGFDMGGTGVELFEFDPQTAAISLAADINVGGSSFPGSYHNINDVLFFLASTSTEGREMYMYDGFNAPERVTDIDPGPGSSFWDGFGFSQPEYAMAYYNNHIFFTATDGGFTHRLFAYDPAADTIHLIDSLNSGSQAIKMAIYSKKLWFGADPMFPGGLYYYDHMADSVTDFNSIIAGNDTLFSAPGDLTLSNGMLFFSNFEINSPFGGTEPFVLIDSVALTVKSLSFDGEVLAYPNPTNGDATLRITLKDAAKLNIMMVDMTGKLVYNSGLKQYTATANEATLPMQQLPAGNYVYAIVDDSGKLMYRGKLVKE